MLGLFADDAMPSRLDRESICTMSTNLNILYPSRYLDNLKLIMKISMVYGD